VIGHVIQCRALLFDMDGVLVDSRAVVERTWHRWGAHRGVDPAPVLAIAHGRRVSDTLRAVTPNATAAAIAREVAWLDDAEANDFEGITAVPGARDFLAALPAGRWAMVTSASREIAAKRLAAAGIPVPALVVSSEDVARGKPDPEGYLAGARLAGAVPADCVVFEDAPVGVAAGMAAGARVIALATSHAPAQLAGAVAIAPDFTHVALSPKGNDFCLEVSGY
jgi:sugar-phosphatase